MFDDLLEANRRYATGFSLGGIPSRAQKGIAIVTCMDTRIEPLALLGLRPGDAKILRNAGARVTEDTLRSLALATAYLGIGEIAVMQHTDCALAHRSDAELAAGLPGGAGGPAGRWELLGMEDPDAALVGDVQAVRNCELLSGPVEVEGWRYDVETGLVVRVVPA